MIITLSHTLSEDVPFYPGVDKPKLTRLYDLEKGDLCNSFFLTTSNHAGTHVDGPYHFDPNGRKIADYQLEELMFTRPAVLDLPLGEGHLIHAADLRGVSSLPNDTDILLLRSGFSKFRVQDPAAYVERGPGFSREAAEYLTSALPDLRALVMDFVSAASSLYLEEGCDAHRVFLGCPGYGRRSVLLVEDACLPASLPPLRKVFVIPWFFKGLDSAPCTVFAEQAE